MIGKSELALGRPVLLLALALAACATPTTEVIIDPTTGRSFVVDTETGQPIDQSEPRLVQIDGGPFVGRVRTEETQVYRTRFRFSQSPPNQSRRFELQAVLTFDFRTTDGFVQKAQAPRDIRISGCGQVNRQLVIANVNDMVGEWIDFNFRPAVDQRRQQCLFDRSQFIVETRYTGYASADVTVQQEIQVLQWWSVQRRDDGQWRAASIGVAQLNDLETPPEPVDVVP